MTSDLGIATGGRIVVSPYNSCDLGGFGPPFFLPIARTPMILLLTPPIPTPMRC